MGNVWSVKGDVGGVSVWSSWAAGMLVGSGSVAA